MTDYDPSATGGRPLDHTPAKEATMTKAPSAETPPNTAADDASPAGAGGIGLRDVAPDGYPLPPATRTFDQFIAGLEDGDFNADLTRELAKLHAILKQRAQEQGGKPKAGITVKLNFVLDDDVFHIESKFDTKLPPRKRRASVRWGTHDHHFTGQNPRQLSMFGVRDASSNTPIKDL